MRSPFSDTLSELLSCVKRISKSETLTRQQQNDLQSIQSLGENLVSHFHNSEKEINNLKQRLKEIYQSSESTPLYSSLSNEVHVLLVLMFARLRQSINLDELLDAVVLETHQALPSDQVIVCQISDRLIKYEAVSDARRSLVGKSIPSVYTDPEWLEGYQKCISQVIDDVTAPDVISKVTRSLLSLGIRSAIAVAIPNGKNLWGLLIVHQYEHSRYWQAWEIELLEKIGTQLAILIHQMQIMLRSDSIKIERDQIIAKLRYSQSHDSLTGLPNRNLFMESLDLAFTKLQVNPQNNFAVLFIDCDHLKSINDNFGISVSDRLLQEIGQRLNNYRNSHINSNIIVAKIGSDEFAILIQDLTQNNLTQNNLTQNNLTQNNLTQNIEPKNLQLKDFAIRLAEQISESIKQPFLINGQNIFTSISIGIVISDPEYMYANEILRDANIAMHSSRRLGRGKYALFNKDMNQGAKVRWQLETDIRYALERQEFHLVYQPIVSLHQHELVGFEVLLRWIHPIQGLISPEEFLPIAEETGEIIRIGYWVLESACDQLHEWQRKFPNITPLTLAINVSTLQVIQLDFVERFQAIIAERGIKPDLVKLEITETVLMKDIEVSAQKLEQLRAIGVQVYIDDFGAGFSSFSYLQNLPIDVLKIDRSFTNKISTDIKSQRIIQSILRLANNLGMGIVIEGIETLEELDYFEELGGSSIELQGYYISHPLDTAKATQWIEATDLVTSTV